MKLLSFIILQIGFAATSICQSSINDFTLNIVESPIDSIDGKAYVDISYIISVPSSVHLNKIQLSMGTTAGGTDQFDYLFTGENMNRLPDGVDYSVSDSTLNYHFRTHQQQTYYYAVRIEDAYGNSSVVKNTP